MVCLEYEAQVEVFSDSSNPMVHVNNDLRA